MDPNRINSSSSNFNGLLIPGRESTIRYTSTNHFMDTLAQLAFKHLDIAFQEEFIGDLKSLMGRHIYLIIPDDTSDSSHQDSNSSYKGGTSLRLEQAVQANDIKLLSNPDFMLEAIKENIDAIKYVSEKLQCNKIFIINLLKQNLSIFSHIKSWIDQDFAKEILSAVEEEIKKINLPESRDLWKQVQENLINLFEIRGKILKNYDVDVYSDIDRDDYKKAIKACREDPELFLKLISSDKRFYAYISNSSTKISKNIDFAVSAVIDNFEILEFIRYDLIENEKFIERIFQDFKQKQIDDVLNNPNLDDEMVLRLTKNSYKFMRLILNRNSNMQFNLFEDILQHENIKNRKDLIIKIIENAPDIENLQPAVNYVSKDLFIDEDFLKDCCICVFETAQNVWGPNLGFVPKDFWSNQEFIITLMKELAHNVNARKLNRCILSKVDQSLKDKETFLLELAKINLDLLSEKALKNKNFMIQVIKINSRAYNLIGKDLKQDEDIISATKASKEFEERSSSTESSSSSDTEDSGE